MASTPVRHVTMMMNKIAAKVSGSHPPSATFHMLATKKLVSTTRRNAVMGPATDSDQPQTLRMALNSSTVVSNIVVATAVP